MAYLYQYIPREPATRPGPATVRVVREPHAHPAPGRARRILARLVLPGQAIVAAFVAYIVLVAFLVTFGS